jgi:hypothetical protein
VNRTAALFLLIIGGFLLGVVLFGWQISLRSFNSTVKLEKPAVLWRMEKNGGKIVNLEVLGKKWF